MSPKESALKIITDDTLLNCMHCGLCLPTCPTYDLTKLERYSPRGRIQLTRAIVEENLQDEKNVKDFSDSINSCLGCLACVTACPAGVDYETIFEAAKGRIRQLESHSITKHLLKLVMQHIFPFPNRIKFLAKVIWLIQQSPLKYNIPQHLQRMYELSPLFSEHAFDERKTREFYHHRTVNFLTGCIMNVACADIHQDSIDVINRCSFNSDFPSSQVCCGALHAHNGFLDEAKALAKKNIEAFSFNNASIVVNSAGCGSMMKHYPKLFNETEEWYPKAVSFSRRVLDLSEFLVNQHFSPSKKIKAKVAYQDACHLEHGQKIRNQPRMLLKQVFSEVVELNSPECCGSAGIYNLLEPNWSQALLEKKITAIQKADVDFVITTNPGCLLQLQFGMRKKSMKTKIIHLATALNFSLSAG